MAENEHPWIHVRFYHGAVLDQGLSDTAGRKIFKDVEMVEAKYPGDPGRSNVSPAHGKCFMYRPKPGEEDDGKGFLTWAERFPEEYARFKANDPTAERSGTPLEHAPFLTPAQVFELRAINVHTVEALARLSESAIAKYHLRPKVEQAKVWLGEAEASAAVAESAAKAQALEARFAKLEAELAAARAGKTETDDPETWADDKLRDYLTEKGIAPRANAARDKLVAAAREVQAMGNEVAA
jgi:hypothetical protein